MDNCIIALKTLLKQLNVPCTTAFIEDNILSHPEYPSLLSISDTLEKYDVESLPVKIGLEKLKEVPFPCLIQISKNGATFFCVIRNFINNEVEYYDENGKLIKVSQASFINLWTGICLLAQITETSEEPNIKSKLLGKRIFNFFAFSILILVSIYASIVFLNSTSYKILPERLIVAFYTITKLIGLAASGMILWFEVDQYNPTIQNFCSGSGKINCGAVLNSKYAKMFNGLLSIGLISFAYFFGSSSYLFVNGFSDQSLSPLSYMSIVSLPIIVISLYYQGFVIKQWCKFCVVIQVVLLTEFVLTLIGSLYLYPLDYVSLLPLITLLLLPIPLWNYIKPLLENQKEVNLYKRGLKRLKNNPDVFRGLLFKSRKIQHDTQGLGISLNELNQNDYNILKVCNPYCEPCAKAHPILEELVEKEKINLQIVFTTGTDKVDAKWNSVAHFMTLEAEEGGQIRKALDYWYHYEKKDYEDFANKYPVNGKLEWQKDKINAMHRWCDAEKITHTPTLFVNGYELPREYDIADLKDLLI